MNFVRLLLLIVRLVLTYLLCSLSTVIVANSSKRTSENSIPKSNETFMYFAYGSNLLSKRIHSRNPTAERRTIGKLENYRLDFSSQSCNWNGALATVVEDVNYHVWGAIWEVHVSNIDGLDRQEGVDQSITSKPVTRSIVTPTGELIECRFYQHVNQPDKFYELDDLPIDRQPSRTYFNCLFKGAVERQLPTDYKENVLYKVRHNNQKANNRVFRKMCDCDS